MTSRGTFVLTSVVLAQLMLACEDSKVECDCTDPSLRVHVPASRAAVLVDVVTSGPACPALAATCMLDPGAAGTVCVLRAVAAGNCHVDVDFSSGPARFSADAQIVPGDACCGGFYADPPSAADIDVPGAAADAGGAG